jgi:hypothetical protein
MGWFVPIWPIDRRETMPAIRKCEAVEKLAQAVDAASCEDLVDIYAELFPDRERLHPIDTGKRRPEIADYVRTKMAPEEMVDLWNVVFPSHRNVYYDEVEESLCYTQEVPWYTGR